MNPYLYAPPPPTQIVLALELLSVYNGRRGYTEEMTRGKRLLLHWWSQGLINVGSYR